MRAFLVRHGESASNADASVVSLPVEAGDRLTERGFEQSRVLGRSLRDAGVTELISSPMRRARETAAAIGEELGLEPEIDDEIYELKESEDYGVLAVEEQKLRRWSVRMTAHPDDPGHSEGGESFDQVRQRARSFGARLAERDSQALPLVVTHGIFLRFFLMDNVLGDAFNPGMAERLWNLRTANCGVCVFESGEPYDVSVPPPPGWICSTWMARPWSPL
jgi:broad specificity phosphatase PhoE